MDLAVVLVGSKLVKYQMGPDVETAVESNCYGEVYNAYLKVRIASEGISK